MEYDSNDNSSIYYTIKNIFFKIFETLNGKQLNERISSANESFTIF